MKNRIYFFTGTGNSYIVAKKIADAIGDCQLVAISYPLPTNLLQPTERIGFVFPNYKGRLPQIVNQFIRQIQLTDLQDIYTFAIVTYGGTVGNTLKEVNSLLKKRNWVLNYGSGVRSYPNAVTYYPMIKGVNFFKKISDRQTQKVIEKIIDKRTSNIKELTNNTSDQDYQRALKISKIALGYNVNSDCVSCGICQSVCPVQNVKLENGRPTFGSHCQGCMACIQFCPKRAINYLNKTQKRGRYTHPDVSHEELSKYYQRNK